MWEVVTDGCSGDTVLRRPCVYRKQGPGVAEEVAKLRWLRELGFPAPEVLEVGQDWFEMREAPGRAAHEPWPEQLRSGVVDAIAELCRELHALPVADCPFDRRLAVTIPAARDNAERGRVDLDDLDECRAGWTEEDLLAELERTTPASEDVVLTHGDPSLPNVVLDPETLEITGILDLGRLGLADRYLDLAITSRSLFDVDLNAQFGPEYADRFLRRYGIAEPDRAKLEFYRLLDEFF